MLWARIAALFANKATPKTLNRATGIILVILGIVVLSMDETDTSIPDVVKTNEGWKSLKCVKENHVGVINIILFSLKDVLYMADQYQSIFNAIEQAL